MQPSSLRDGPTSARSSASSSVSWPSRARRMTMSVTAFFGSFSFRPARDLRGTLFLLERLDAALFALRFAIMAGIVLQLAKTARGSCAPARIHSPAKKPLFLGQLTAGVQAVEVENGVQHHGVGSARLAAIDRIDRKEHHVSFACWNIDDGGMLGDFVSTFDQTGNEQILLIRITEDHSRSVGWRDHAEAVAPLFVGYRRRFPNLGGKFLGSLSCGAAHGEVWVIRGAAASGASVRFVAKAAAPPRTGNATEGKNRPVVTISSDFLVVTIGDGAATVH